MPRRDRPVTDEMVAAGVEVLLAYCPDTAAGDEVDRRMVADIFRSMARLESGAAVPQPGSARLGRGSSHRQP